MPNIHQATASEPPLAGFFFHEKGLVMDSLHYRIRSGKRGAAADHIAYIMREGRYSVRKDLVTTGHGNMPSFATPHPPALWKASDQFERKNGSTFRSITISLPAGLNLEQLAELSWRTTRRVAGTKPFQFALHAPPATIGDSLNPHVHIVICDRLPDGHDRPPEQMFKRYNATHPERGGCRKDSGGKSPLELRTHVREQRRIVSEEINAMLAESGADHRIDHRTFKERGIARSPEKYLGPAKIRGMTVEERAALVRERTG